MLGMCFRFLAWALISVLSACTHEHRSSVTPAGVEPPRATTFARGLEHPWSLAFLPDGSLLVTERPGRLRRVSAEGSVAAEPLSGVPEVDAHGSGGLLDVLLAPDFSQSRLLYLSYSEPGSGAEAGRNGLAVARARLAPDGLALQDLQVIYRQRPKVASTAHHGGRMLWRGDGTLLLTQGERQALGEREKAQDLAFGHGKIVRMRGDGGVPADNPFVGAPLAQAHVLTYGHRNVQGLALQPGTGEVFAIEHGPQGGDEINRLQPGSNYGWPKVSHGCEYGAPVATCAPVGGARSGPGLEDPLSVWAPASIAPSGATFYRGNGFPEWRGDLLIGALAGKALWRVRFQGTKELDREKMFESLDERIRDVHEGPDGWLYLLTDNRAGRILRIER